MSAHEHGPECNCDQITANAQKVLAQFEADGIDEADGMVSLIIAMAIIYRIHDGQDDQPPIESFVTDVGNTLREVIPNLKAQKAH